MDEPEGIVASVRGLLEASTSDTIRGIATISTVIERGAWRDLLRRSLDNAIIDLEAGQLGFSPTDDEVQISADEFRLARGLTSVESFYEWMEQPPPISLDDFELLILRRMRRVLVRKRLAEGRIEARFEQQKWRYLSGLFSHIEVTDEGIARELYYVIAEENEDFHTLCRQYSETTGIARRLGGYQAAQWGAELGPERANEALNLAAGNVLAPVRNGEKWLLTRIEVLSLPVLDQTTRLYIEAELFSEWLQQRRRSILARNVVEECP
jgi:hypothetical protein